MYDQYGEEGLKQQGGNQFHDPFDIFAQFGFGGGGGGHRGGKRGNDVNFDLQVNLEDLYLGNEVDLERERQIICPKCRGSGAESPDDLEKCDECNGNGVRILRQQLAPGMFQQMQILCQKCGGKGSTVKHKCKSCRGEKVKKTKHEVTAVVERGMKDGDRIVFEREADQHPDVTPGDIVVTIRLKEHSAYLRRNDHLYLTETISLYESLAGFTRSIKTLDNRNITLTVPASKITTPGQVYTIKNEGMPNRDHPSERGNLYVEFQVLFPAKLNADVQGKLEKLLPTPRFSSSLYTSAYASENRAVLNDEL